MKMKFHEHGYAFPKVESEGCCVPHCVNTTCSGSDLELAPTVRDQCVKTFMSGIYASTGKIVCNKHFTSEHFFYFGIILGQIGGASLRDKLCIPVTEAQGRASDVDVGEGRDASDVVEGEGRDTSDVDEREGRDKSNVDEGEGRDASDVDQREGRDKPDVQDRAVNMDYESLVQAMDIEPGVVENTTQVGLLVHEVEVGPHNSSQSQLHEALVEDSSTIQLVVESFVCKLCHKWVKNEYQLRKHMSTHGDDVRPFICQVPHCGKRFFEQIGLNSHMSTHIVRNFACVICDDRFKTEHHLRSHTATHGLGYVAVASEAPLSTKHVTVDEAKYHNSIIQTDAAKFECSTCKKQFKFKTSLRKHMVRHDSETNKSFVSNVSIRDESMISNQTPDASNLERADGWEKQGEDIIFSNEYDIQEVVVIGTETQEQETGLKSVMQDGEVEFELEGQAVDQVGLYEYVVQVGKITGSEILEEGGSSSREIEEGDAGNVYIIQEEGFVNETEIERETNYVFAVEEIEVEVGDESSCEGCIKDDMVLLNDVRPFLCDLCHKLFKTNRELKRHRKRHFEGGKIFICPVPLCNKRYYEKAHYNNHLSTHSEDRNFMCNFCDKRYKSKRYLREHVKTHQYNDGSRIFVCTEPQCTKRFNKRSILKNHIRSHYPPQFACSTCDRRFKLKVSLREHTKKCIVPDKSEELFVLNFNPLQVERCNCEPCTCGACNKQVNLVSNPVDSASDLHESVQTQKNSDESGTFICTVPHCAKRFRTKNILDDHVRAHYERKFVCDKCGSRFKMEYGLQAHAKKCGKSAELVLRCGDEPCECGACDECRSKSSATINRSGSRRSKKFYDINRAFICPLAGCAKRFNTSKVLKSHMDSHRAPQFVCHTCGKCFKLKSSWQAHSKVCVASDALHELNIKPPVAPGCGNDPCTCGACNRQASFKTIVARNRSKPTYDCHVLNCHEQYSYRHHLKYHMVTSQNDDRLFLFCDNCGNRFKYKSTLNAHFRNQAKDGEVLCRDYECHVPLCHEQFKWSHHVRFHVPVVQAQGKK